MQYLRHDRLYANTDEGLNQHRIGTVCDLDFLNGHPWGVAHPNHSYWASPQAVRLLDDADGLRLHVRYDPYTAHGKQYAWASGEVRTAQAFKYGRIDFDFLLPLGRNLWPAVWLYGDDWPPEIDILEGWTSSRLRFMPDSGAYRYSPLRDAIFPGVHCFDNETRVGGFPFRGSTLRGLIDVWDYNHATFLHTPERLEVRYNGVRVFSLRTKRKRDTQMMQDLGVNMNLYLSLQTTDDFDTEDYYSAIRPFFTVRNIRVEYYD